MMMMAGGYEREEIGCRHVVKERSGFVSDTTMQPTQRPPTVT
jgi:hypothetical protein